VEFGGPKAGSGSESSAAPARRRRRRPLEDPWTLGQFVRNLQEGVYVTTTAGRILDANPAFLRMFGVASLRDMRRFKAGDLLVEPQRRVDELEVLAEQGAVREFEFDIRRPDGEIRTVLDTAYQVVDPATGESVYHGILIDITDRKILERQLFQAALRDPLTGCFNRRFLLETEGSLERAAEPWGVIVVDIDHFKAYNDRFGHHVGDRVLVRVARFLGNVVRPEDAVVRIGGDEFLLLFSGSGAAATKDVVRRLRESGPEEVPVSLSYGWAVRENCETLEQTTRRADRRLILVRAKERRSRPARREAGDERP
jgi:diguanylate cyclase (GGDEF)-like protein/PAS domain S-box-containing protein